MDGDGRSRELEGVNHKAPALVAKEHCFTERAYGGASARNHVELIEEISAPINIADCYSGMFRHTVALRDYVEQNGTVRGTTNLPCYSDFVWFDMDRECLEDALKEARLLCIQLERISPTINGSLIIYFSGCKGFHIGIPAPLFGLEANVGIPEQIKGIALSIADDIPIDAAIYERNRLWRFPNTINSKSGLYKLPLTFEELAECTIEQIKEMAKSSRGEARPLLVYEGQYEPIPALVALAEQAKAELMAAKDTQHKTTRGNGPGWIAQALVDLHDGNRNTSLTRVCGRLRRDGYTDEDMRAFLLHHAVRSGLESSELDEIIRSVSRYSQAVTQDDLYSIDEDFAGQGSKELIPLSMSELLQMKFDQPQWQVDSLFPSEGVGIIGGKPGIGKSWILMDLARTCAVGGIWLDQFPTRRAKVLYLDEESSLHLLQSRFAKLLAAQTHDANLNIHFVVGKGLSFSSRGSVRRIDALLDRLRPNVVIVDSLIRVHRSDENSATDMAKVFDAIKKLVRKYHCLFVIADHHRKPGEHESSSDMMLRGSSEKLAFVDCLLSLRADGENIVVEHSKARFTQTVASLLVKLEEPEKGQIWLRVLGDQAALRKIESQAVIKAFISRVVGEESEICQKDLLNRARENSISIRSLRAALKVPEELGLSVDYRKPNEGRGGPKAFYRLATTVHPSIPYKGENSETVIADQGAA